MRKETCCYKIDKTQNILTYFEPKLVSVMSYNYNKLTLGITTYRRPYFYSVSFVLGQKDKDR